MNKIVFFNNYILRVFGINPVEQFPKLLVFEDQIIHCISQSKDPDLIFF